MGENLQEYINIVYRIIYTLLFVGGQLSPGV